MFVQQLQRTTANNVKLLIKCSRLHVSIILIRFALIELILSKEFVHFLYELGLAATAIRKKRSFLLGFVHTVLFKTVDVEVLKVAKFTQILNHLSEDRYCLKDKGGIVTEAVFYSQSQGTAEEIVCCHLPSRPVDVTCHVLCNGTQWFEHERNLIYY